MEGARGNGDGRAQSALDLERLATDLDFIESVETQAAGLVIKVAARSDIPELVRALAASGTDIFSISEESLTLQDAYLALVRGDGV